MYSVGESSLAGQKRNLIELSEDESMFQQRLKKKQFGYTKKTAQKFPDILIESHHSHPLDKYIHDSFITKLEHYVFHQTQNLSYMITEKFEKQQAHFDKQIDEIKILLKQVINEKVGNKKDIARNVEEVAELSEEDESDIDMLSTSSKKVPAARRARTLDMLSEFPFERTSPTHDKITHKYACYPNITATYLSNKQLYNNFTPLSLGNSFDSSTTVDPFEASLWEKSKKMYETFHGEIHFLENFLPLIYDLYDFVKPWEENDKSKKALQIIKKLKNGKNFAEEAWIKEIKRMHKERRYKLTHKIYQAMKGYDGLIMTKDEKIYECKWDVDKQKLTPQIAEMFTVNHSKWAIPKLLENEPYVLVAEDNDEGRTTISKLDLPQFTCTNLYTQRKYNANLKTGGSNT